ncbi:hypothetical protein JGS39_14695 [Streptomyces sp. P01-B04]|uniref:hypothetical protein n=1 Tax=Streptomyces poriferorum TaxID=2798799 RepID=UPI001C5D1848|nr:hypothetical protein [Streptomyces poriferorum]MBW5250227.1 hypothetical protein [Streptomyces poriferorum]MBW5259791.1 hypothetical protein [Streptomyces poriferorum]
MHPRRTDGIRTPGTADHERSLGGAASVILPFTAPPMIRGPESGAQRTSQARTRVWVTAAL